MGIKFVKKTIGDCFDLINGYAFKSNEFISSGNPVIKIKNIKAGYFSEHEFSYVDDNFLITKTEKIVQESDLLISMTGNRHDGTPETWVGKIALFPYKKINNFFLNQRVGALRVKDNLITIEPQPVLITDLASRACEYNLSITDPPSFPNQIFG